MFIYRADRVAWISVSSPFTSDDDNSAVRSNMGMLQEAWSQLQASGATITKEAIADLASMTGKTSGKWLFFVATGNTADSNWQTVAEGVVKRLIPNAYAAKISPNENPKGGSGNKEHVICVYNKNFLDMNEVMAAEKGLRDIGIQCWLCYKPDIYTYLDIYKVNKWGLKPTIYHSNFDKSTGQAKVSTS